MSSINPVVGVTVCIGALGAGLAYLAFNSHNDDDEQVIEKNVEECKGEEMKEIKEESQEGGNIEEKEETKSLEKKSKSLEEDVEDAIKKHANNKEVEQENQKSKMSTYLKETYANMQTAGS